MKPRELTIEILIIIVLLALALGAFNPYWMPMGMHMLLLLVLTLLFGSFALFVWKEKGGDEREVAIRHMSDRFAFLVGGGILALAIVAEGILMHSSNPWILGAFIAMILAKVASSIYNRQRH